MDTIWANNFFEIIPTLNKRPDILKIMSQLITSNNILGKSLEGGNRKSQFKDILLKAINNIISLDSSYSLVEQKLPPSTSIYTSNTRVFSKNWGERLIRTNLSIFYNYSVLTFILSHGQSKCIIPHSDYEDPNSKCIQYVSKVYDAQILLDSLINIYIKGHFTNSDYKVPHHPHCTHVIIPYIE